MTNPYDREPGEWIDSRGNVRDSRGRIVYRGRRVPRSASYRGGRGPSRTEYRLIGLIVLITVVAMVWRVAIQRGPIEIRVEVGQLECKKDIDLAGATGTSWGAKWVLGDVSRAIESIGFSYRGYKFRLVNAPPHLDYDLELTPDITELEPQITYDCCFYAYQFAKPGTYELEAEVVFEDRSGGQAAVIRIPYQVEIVERN